MPLVKDNLFICDENEKILEFLEDKSSSMFNYINTNGDSEYFLIRKYITFSDLGTFGKRHDIGRPLTDNILYYLTADEMQEIENRESEPFAATGQSNITVPPIFYEKLGIEQLKRRQGQQTTKHNHVLINNYANVYLVNDTAKYFTIEYTNKVLEKLNKQIIWDSTKYNAELEEGVFTSIELRHAIHGIGTQEDVIFHKLRRNIFKNDSLILLIEKNDKNQLNLFILLDKNPRFFSIINETNEAWEKYQIREKKLIEYTTQDLIDDEKNRRYQNKWRFQLAEEIMNFTTVEGGVFCPFTYIEGKFDEIGTLYRASHIKSFESCDSDEAFDINNGLLLVANADALFDKHLITIGEDKELVFSFLLAHDNLLKSKLLLNQPIFKMILNENRMKYIEDHRKVFYEKEEKRKK